MLRFCLCLPLLCLAWLTTGCQSFKSAPDDCLASVVVSNRTPAEINTAVLGVFRRNSFQGGQTSSGHYRFERAGSTMNRLAYGDLFGAGVAVRVLVSVTPMPGTVSTRISCNAEIVQDPGDPIVEDSYKVKKFQKKPYQDLLDEVANRLK